MSKELLATAGSPCTIRRDARERSRDIEEPGGSRFWYERAAALEYPPALNDLGRLYLAGAGVPKNYVRAKDFIRASGEAWRCEGDEQPRTALSQWHRSGKGHRPCQDLVREGDRASTTRKRRRTLNYLEQAALLDGAQVAARRASCMETCETLHRSYVNSVCDRYSATADGDKPERTKCVGMSLTLAQRCRASCREWAPTSLADNKCVACFQTLIACSFGQEPPDSQGNDKPYAVDSKACLAASADCTANCRGQTASTSGTPDATGAKPN